MLLFMIYSFNKRDGNEEMARRVLESLGERESQREKDEETKEEA